MFEHTVFARKASGAEAAAAPEAVEKSTESWDPELNPARRSGANQSSVLSAQRDGAKAGSSRPGKTRIEQLVPIPPAVQAGGAMQMRRGGHRLMQEEEEKSEEGEEDVDIDEGSWGSEVRIVSILLMRCLLPTPDFWILVLTLAVLLPG